MAAGGKGFGEWFEQKQQEEKKEAEGGIALGFWQGLRADISDRQALLPTFVRGQQQPQAATEADVMIMGMSYKQRFKLFVFCLLASVLFFVLAVVVGLPTLMLRPSKFALTFTMGSLCFMGSFAMLKGPSVQLRSMCAMDRLPFSVCYVGSMLGTLYACLIAGSYPLVVGAASVQMVALLWYFAAFIPGGSRGMKYVVSGIVKTVKMAVVPCTKAVYMCIRRVGGSMLPTS